MFKITGDNELIFYLNKTSSKIKNEANKGLKDVGKYLEEKVKEKFGNYQKGWKKLKRETVAAKQRRRAKLSGSSKKSFKKLISNINSKMDSDEPLFLFGELMQSIKHENKNLETIVYSDNEYAAVHEYG